MGNPLKAITNLFSPPKIKKPKPPPEAQKTQLDPNRAQAIAAARRRQQQAAAAQGRQSFRIDLNAGPVGDQTRSGVVA